MGSVAVSFFSVEREREREQEGLAAVVGDARTTGRARWRRACSARAAVGASVSARLRSTRRLLRFSSSMLSSAPVVGVLAERDRRRGTAPGSARRARPGSSRGAARSRSAAPARGASARRRSCSSRSTAARSRRRAARVPACVRSRWPTTKVSCRVRRRRCELSAVAASPLNARSSALAPAVSSQSLAPSADSRVQRRSSGADRTVKVEVEIRLEDERSVAGGGDRARCRRRGADRCISVGVSDRKSRRSAGRGRIGARALKRFVVDRLQRRAPVVLVERQPPARAARGEQRRPRRAPPAP